MRSNEMPEVRNLNGEGLKKGGLKMKIAVSSTGPGLDAQISPVFGRCPWFVIVEVKDKEIKSSKDLQNTAAVRPGGAGITAAQIVANEKVDVVITSNIGPRAFDVMRQLGIKIFIAGPGTVREVVQRYLKGELQEMSAPTGPGFGPRWL